MILLSFGPWHLLCIKEKQEIKLKNTGRKGGVNVIGINGLTAIHNRLSNYMKVNQMTVNWLKTKDQGGDNAFNIDEFSGDEAVFKDIDKNGDGKLDAAELNSAYYSQQLNQMTVDLINSKDTDEDQLLNADELGVSSEIFSNIDTNSDGTADVNELNTAYLMTQVNQMTVDLVNAKDTDGDQLLTADELGVSQDTFSTIDTNNDGTAGTDELNTAFFTKNPIWEYLKVVNASSLTQSNSTTSTGSIFA